MVCCVRKGDGLDDGCFVLFGSSGRKGLDIHFFGAL
jgi:hypothetical protein